MSTIIAPPVLTGDERLLLAAVNRHRRADGWTPGDSETIHPGAKLAADWRYGYTVDGKDGRTLRIRLLTDHGSTHRVAAEVDVDSVREAIDVAVALDLLPQGLSSAYRAGLEAPRYTDPLRLTAEAIDRAYMDGGNVGWQILDARDETTWHDITGIVDRCEDPDCTIDGLMPGVVCVIVLSTAWAAGQGHLESDELVTVRIPARQEAAK